MDYMAIILFSLTQIGFILFYINEIFDFVKLHYQVHELLGVGLMLAFLNFIFLMFTKIILLLKDNKHTSQA